MSAFFSYEDIGDIPVNNQLQMEEDKYPHWKDALFGEDSAYANLKCAVKYGIWHAAYALLTVLGAGLVIAAVVIDKITGSSLANRVMKIADHPKVKFAGRAIVVSILGIWVLFALGMVAVEFYHNPIYLVYTAAAIAGVIVALIGIIIVEEKTQEYRQTVVRSANGVAVRVGTKAKETPGVRRIYGRCPVSMDIEPKWYQNLKDKFEANPE